SSAMTLLVGAAQKPFLLHFSLLAAHSKAFRALCDRNWSETHSREVDWSEWDVETVKLYLDWIYTGSYSVSESSRNRKTPPAETETETTPEPTVDKETFRPLTPLSACFTPISTPGPDAISLDTGDFATISIAHAKLYVLAQYTNTPALEKAALSRLHRILKDQQFVESVVNLVEYVYANTNALVHSEEPMRRVISTFCAFRFLDLLGQPAFLKLQLSGGDFVVDFCEKSGRLIDWDKKRSDEMIEERDKLVEERDKVIEEREKKIGELVNEYTRVCEENRVLVEKAAELRKGSKKKSF
ncbi:hypothetical protein BDD12DRAFT_730151, partial [Trichophaea hybrida]